MLSSSAAASSSVVSGAELQLPVVDQQLAKEFDVFKTGVVSHQRSFDRSLDSKNTRRKAVESKSMDDILAEIDDFDVLALARKQKTNVDYERSFKRFWSDYAEKMPAHLGQTGRVEDFDRTSLLMCAKILAQAPSIPRSRHLMICHIKGFVKSKDLWRDEWESLYGDLFSILTNLCLVSKKDRGLRLDHMLLLVRELANQPKVLAGTPGFKNAPSKQSPLSTSGFAKLADVVLTYHYDYIFGHQTHAFALYKSLEGGSTSSMFLGSACPRAVTHSDLAASRVFVQYI